MKKPKLIFRVEDNQGLGPYNGVIGTPAFRHPVKNPSPPRDPMEGDRVLSDYLPPPFLMPSDLLFGFSTAAQAKSWFFDPKIMTEERWSELGGHIEVYKLDETAEVAEARRQTVFAASHAVARASLPLSDLWEKTAAELETEARSKFDASLSIQPPHEH